MLYQMNMCNVHKVNRVADHLFVFEGDGVVSIYYSQVTNTFEYDFK